MNTNIKPLWFINSQSRFIHIRNRVGMWSIWYQSGWEYSGCVECIRNIERDSIVGWSHNSRYQYIIDHGLSVDCINTSSWMIIIIIIIIQLSLIWWVLMIWED